MNNNILKGLIVFVASLLTSGLHAAATEEELAKLGTFYTPMGSVLAGNEEGTIPDWKGGFTTPIAGYEQGQPRPNPFASDEVALTITAANMKGYEERLSEGVKELLRRYPETFKLNVYPTRRTEAAPQWVYDNIRKNAENGILAENSIGILEPQGVYGGIPFPFPKTGEELMWNNLLYWEGESNYLENSSYAITDGNRTLLTSVEIKRSRPYYFMDGSAESFDGNYWNHYGMTVAPPMRAGEAIIGKSYLNPEKEEAYTYLPGQRRVRRLPNTCCDTPAQPTAGLTTFDELAVFSGRIDTFDWKILGLKEMYVPYNMNGVMQVSVDEALMENHMNPEHYRWELHRVWVVEATVKEGKRHKNPRNFYYVHDGSWFALMGDRFDSNGNLAVALFDHTIAVPELPGIVRVATEVYDIATGDWVATSLANGHDAQWVVVEPWHLSTFNPQTMAAEGR